MRVSNGSNSKKLGIQFSGLLNLCFLANGFLLECLVPVKNPGFFSIDGYALNSCEILGVKFL